MEQAKRVTPDRKLFENIFLNGGTGEIIHLLSDGIDAVINNAKNLYDDAQLMFKNSRWTSWRFLLTTANEEMAKSYILLDACRLDFSRHHSVLKRLCYAFYDHVSKYAYGNILNSKDAYSLQDAKIEWQDSTTRWALDDDAQTIHETYFLREAPLYVDFLDYDQIWSTPLSLVSEYNYSMGSGIPDFQAALERLKMTQQAGLFSSNTLNLINENFKKHYFSETTSDDVLINLHKKTAKQIETKTGISATTYQESSLYTIPLYHFLTMQK
jgi:AbiV family abortive infection protein